MVGMLEKLSVDGDETIAAIRLTVAKRVNSMKSCMNYI